MRYSVAFLLVPRAIKDNQPAIRAKLYRLEIVSIVFPATDREWQHINASGTRIDYRSHHTGGSAAPGLDYVVTGKVRFSPASLPDSCSELSALLRQNYRMISAFKDGAFAIVFESRYLDLAGCRTGDEKRQSKGPYQEVKSGHTNIVSQGALIAKRRSSRYSRIGNQDRASPGCCYIESEPSHPCSR
jgi:hypothetical protein